MTPAQIEAAAARLRSKPNLINRLAEEARSMSNVAARRHSLGHEAIYVELNNGLRNAGLYPYGAEQLLAVERVHAAMTARKAEADAEIEREHAAATQRNAACFRDILAGGSRPPRDPALDEAMRVAKLRLEAVWPQLGSGSEDDFLTRCDDIDTLCKTLMSTVGISRRSSRARARSVAAAEAVAAAKSAFAPKDAPPDDTAEAA